MNRAIRLLTLVIFFSAVAAFGCFRIIDTDIWLYLRTGERICASLSIPRSDIFSYTAAGRPWVDVHWLAQVFFYLVDAAAGPTGLTLLRLLIVLCIFVILYRCCRASAGPGVTLGVLTLSLLVSNERFLIKPSLVALLFATILIALLERSRRGRRLPIPALVVLQVLWANMHPSFFLGPLLILFYYADSLIKPPTGRRPRFGAAFLLACGACLITPYGPSLLLQPFRQLSSPLFRERVTPWKPASLSFPSPPSARVFAVMLVLCIASIVVNARRVRPAHLLTALTFGYLACSSRRHMALFALLSAPGICYNLSSAVHAASARFPRAARAARVPAFVCLALILVFLLHGVLTNSFYVRQRSLRRFGLGASRIAFPDDALDYLTSFDREGRIFCNYDIGSYVAGRLHPRRAVNIDGRNLVYGEDAFREYLDAVESIEGLERFAKKHGVTALLFSHNSRDVKHLLPALWDSPRWRPVYADDRAVVFFREDGSGAPPSLDLSSCRVKGDRSQNGFPLAELRAGELLFTLGFTDCAGDAFRRALRRSPSLPEAHNFLGIIAARCGDREEAKREFLAACAQSASYAEPRINLSTILLDEGAQAEAERYARRAAALSPKSARAHGILGLAYMNGEDLEGAEHELRVAVALDAGDAEIRNNLGTVYEKQQRRGNAIIEYEEARSLSADYFAPRFNLGRLYTLDGDLEKALAVYREALALNPDHVGTLKNMALIHLRRGEREDARLLLEEAVRSDPSDRGARRLLRNILRTGSNKINL